MQQAKKLVRHSYDKNTWLGLIFFEHIPKTWYSLQESLGENGVLTSDQVAELLSQQREAESNLESQMEARRNQQMAALRSRISQRRKKRMDDLREKQERDKMEVCKSTYRKDSDKIPTRLKPA